MTWWIISKAHSSLPKTIPGLSSPFPNPGFQVWKRQDRIISSWLLCFMFELILNLVLGCSTAGKIWSTLQQIFSSRSMTHKMKYKIKLQTINKNGFSLHEYFAQIYQCVDALASIVSIYPLMITLCTTLLVLVLILSQWYLSLLQKLKLVVLKRLGIFFLLKKIEIKVLKTYLLLNYRL